MKPDKSRLPAKLKSVNRVMWAYFCLLAFLLIFLVEIVFFIIVPRVFRDKACEIAEQTGKAVSREIEFNPYFDKNFTKFRSNDIDVYLISLDGEIVAPADAEIKISYEIWHEVKQRLAGAENGENISRVGGKLNYAQRVGNFGGCIVYVAYNSEVMISALREMVLYMTLVGLCILLLALIISYKMSQKLSRGLKETSVTAARLGKGDYSVNFTNTDYKEMAQLSDTLNYIRDEVKKSEDFQHEILANVTHDLKTPLTMIKAYASMIKEISGDNKDKREKHLQVIIDEADRLTGLVNDVLNVSKLSSNIAELNLKVFNLTELLYAIINKFGYLQETQGYSFMLDIDRDLYTRADAEKISQVIYNLLGNAANYTGADKTVYISLKENIEEKRIKFSVRDTGKGIKEEDLKEIWNRFYRVKENHNRPVKGTGLGLNIVKAILENHSFDFGVDSKVNGGSTFWVDFPEVPSEPEK